MVGRAWRWVLATVGYYLIVVGGWGELLVDKGYGYEGYDIDAEGGN